MTRPTTPHPTTPLGILVAASDGGLASVPLRADACGWIATLDGHLFHVTRVRCGPTAPPATWDD